jgi:hypothetical protein
MKIFEINPRHPMILKLLESAPPEDADDDYKVPQEAIDTAWVLHEMALLNGGYPISDPKGHSTRIMNFLQSQLGLESMDLEPHPELPVEEEVPPDLDDLVNMDIDDEEKKPKGSSPEDAIKIEPDEDGNVHIEL